MREVLTIPIEFDTTPIEERLQADGYNDVLRAITNAVMGGMLKALPSNANGYYSRVPPKSLDEVNWNKFVSERFDAWLQEHSREIVDEAAILLASKGVRKKAWRELVHELREAGKLDG